MKSAIYFLVAATLLGVALVVAPPAFAVKYDPAKIYKALNVKEEILNPGIAGTSRRAKTVGGLSCYSSILVYPGAKATYTCAIDNKHEDHEAIYNALKVKEVATNPGIAGSSKMEKSVGGLTCDKSRVVYPGAPVSYACVMTE